MEQALSKSIKLLLPSLLLISNLLGEPAYAQYYSTETQRSEPIVGTLLKVDITGENLFLQKNFELSEGRDFLICKAPQKGIYFVSASIQAAALSEKINGNLNAWFEKNHVPLSSSCSCLYVTESAPIAIITIPFLIELEPGDTIGTRISTSGKEIGVSSIDPPSPYEPGIPSYTITIYKVDSS